MRSAVLEKVAIGDAIRPESVDTHRQVNTSFENDLTKEDWDMIHDARDGVRIIVKVVVKRCIAIKLCHPSEPMVRKLAASVGWSMDPYKLDRSPLDVRDLVKNQFYVHRGLQAATPGAPQDYPPIHQFKELYPNFYSMAYTAEDPPVPPPPPLEKDEFHSLQAEYPCRRTKAGAASMHIKRKPQLLALENTQPKYTRWVERRGTEMLRTNNDQGDLRRAITQLAVEMTNRTGCPSQ